MKKWSIIYGILYECPYKNRLKDCPVNEAEDHSLNGRIRWFENLDTAGKFKVLDHHLDCSYKRNKAKKTQ